MQKSKIRKIYFKVGLKPEPFIMDSPGVNCVHHRKEKDLISRVALSWEKDKPDGQEERVTYGLDINITTNS